MVRPWGAPGDLIQDVRWPGVPRVEEFTYTCSHGISPGTAQIVTAPADPRDPDVFPESFGNLYFSDGVRTVCLRDCKADRIDASYSRAGVTYTLTILDRRWRWRNQFGGLGAVRGRYNQLDARGKLVPWSIRSPEELARFCLVNMGETNYRVVLPPGLRQADGANLDRYLRLGEQFPHTNCNPEFNWDYTPPAEALLQVADYFGARIVLQPYTNRVLVVPLGWGLGTLPDDPYEMDAPGVDDPETPQAVGVAAAPMRIQCRLPLEPVGEEWDGSYLPIDQLSYAPKITGDQAQQDTVTYTSTATPAPPVEITLTWTDPQGNAHTVHLRSSDPALDVAGRWAEILSQLAASEAAGVVSGTAAGSTLTLTGTNPAQPFATTVVTLSGPDAFTVETVAAGAQGGRGWKSTNVGIFSDVVATDELSYTQARAKAVATVFKTFRVLRYHDGRPCAADSRKPPLKLPKFGEVKRVAQIVMQPTKVEQVVPQARIPGGRDKGNVLTVAETVAGGGILPEFYNGRSRDQVATVTGRVWKRIGSVFWDGNPVQNTKTSDRVFVSFSVRNDEFGNQLVEFADYVYEYAPQLPKRGYVEYPVLTIETAVLVTDEEPDQLVRWQKLLPLPGGQAPAEWHVHPDLQVNVVGEYDTYSNPGSKNQSPLPDGKIHRLTGWHYGEGDVEHADPAADFYLANHAKKYETVVGDTRQFVGIRLLDPDGTLHQVSWSIGRSGPTTVASLSTEHAVNVPPFHQRRRAELLPPDRSAAAANQAEFALVKRLFPQPGGQVR